jgi:Zn-dependent M28 family amino/carboxypeptidase
VKRLVDFGPRPSNSEALEKARKYIVDLVQGTGWQVTRQKFVDQTPRGPVTFVNLIARFGSGGQSPVSDATQRVIIASHYDTKIFDTIQFVGADDGGSSTGALIELARVLALDPELARRVELVFFDGEEAVVQFTELDGLYGSRHYARLLRETKRNRQFKFGILWDMIGPTDLNITIPPDSPPELVRDIFSGADALGVRKNFSYFRGPILDDHTPLNESHIPSIDLIDFDFIYWHTADDTLDKLSPESLQKVGAVTLYLLRHADTK